MLRGVISSLVLATVAVSASAQTDTWLEVRTPAFSVITNGTEKDGRRVGKQFEQMRAIFHKVFPDADLDTATPIVVLAISDKQNFQALEPVVYLGQGKTTITGLFLPSAEQTYVLLWLNGPAIHPYAPIYHEYTHFVTSRTGEWVPLWLTEGLAQFYENTLILDGEVRMGRGDAGLQSVLEHSVMLPISTLMAVDTHSPYYHEEDQASIFYAESWALTHYLKTKDEQENSHRVNDYLELVRRNADPVDAATQAFGDLNQLQSALHKYVLEGNYAYIPLQGSIDVDESTFSVRALSQAEADTERAAFLAHDQREGDARILLDAVLRSDPENAAAHATMGLVALRQRRFDEAQKQCEQAVKLDGQNYFAHYCAAVATIQKGAPDPSSSAIAEEHLRTAIKISPGFALNYDALGMLLSMRGKNLDDANEAMLTAVRLDPGTVEIRIDQAQVLTQMKRTKEALDILDLALKMSHTPEQIAAVENVAQTVRRFDAARAKAHPEGVQGVQEVASSGGASGKAAAAAPHSGETDARAIYAPQPDYTEEARRGRREGTCVLSLIVGLDGKPNNITVTKKLGMGLDEKAIEAVSKWKFEPARRNGRPVLTHLTLSIEFKLFGESSATFLELSEKAKTGDPAAEFELAQAFFEGREIPKDENQGLALLQRAAEDGWPQAQFALAERIYGDGNDAGKYVDAYVWYALAQRGGFQKSEQKVTELESRMTPDQLSEARRRVAMQVIPSAK